MNRKLTIGMIGCGVIGDVLSKWIDANTEHDLAIYDPDKRYYGNIIQSDIVFINIHTKPDCYNKFWQIIRTLPNVPIFIRTTIELDVLDKLQKASGLDINYMPEFLSEVTAKEDFNNQTLVFTNHVELLKQVFPDREYIEMTNREAIVAKYTHNAFGALKVTYFNSIYDFCDGVDVNFENMMKAVTLSGYINPEHTKVPHKGSFGYEGKCFPKDVTSLKNQAEAHDAEELHELLDIVGWANSALKYRYRKRES